MRREIKKLLIVLVTTFVSLVLHVQVPTASPITDDRLTELARSLSFVGVVILFFLVAYYLIASVFLRYESKMSGAKYERGLTFGLLVGGIWWLGMIEAVFALGTDFVTEALTGLFDLIPIVVLCLLLSAFMVEDQRTIGRERFDARSALVNAAVFLVIVVGGRVMRYFWGIGGHYLENIGLAVLWTAMFALVISLSYTALSRAGFLARSPLKSALHFTFVLFGVHYALFVYFVPLIFKGLFVTVSIGFGYDLLFVFLSSLTSYWMFSRRQVCGKPL
ncbi:MAG TPA: hypothetical protein VD973_13440 [Symbiobacteriaceae bacterium]|nr:hypothetical protein [Symbiobacteriaceae bacterium]